MSARGGGTLSSRFAKIAPLGGRGGGRVNQSVANQQAKRSNVVNARRNIAPAPAAKKNNKPKPGNVPGNKNAKKVNPARGGGRLAGGRGRGGRGNTLTCLI